MMPVLSFADFIANNQTALLGLFQLKIGTCGRRQVLKVDMTSASHLPTYFGSLYCKQYEHRSDCSLRSSLIRVHIVCLYNCDCESQAFKGIVSFNNENKKCHKHVTNAPKGIGLA